MNRWSGVSEAYATSFATLCEGTIPRILQDLPQGRLLDAGSGTGALVAAATARGHDTVAIDSDPDMVAMTNAVVPDACVQAALPDLPFQDDSFRAVTANFVINHLDDPRAGVGELARVLTPGGRLAMTIWPAGGAGWTNLVNAAFDDGGATAWQGARLPVDRDFPRTVDGLAMLASTAGLEIITSETVTWTWIVEAAALWSGIAGGVATPGARYIAQTEPVREKVRQAFKWRAESMETDGRLSFPCSASYVLATKPPADCPNGLLHVSTDTGAHEPCRRIDSELSSSADH